MFDIGFWELVLIGVVALLVIGPERLPAVARTLGVWIGRGRRLLHQVKADVAQEMKAEELKRLLEQQKNSIATEEILETTRDTLKDIGQGFGQPASTPPPQADDRPASESNDAPPPAKPEPPRS